MDNPNSISIREGDIVIPSSDIIDNTNRRKIFENIFSIDNINQLRTRLITTCLKRSIDTSERDANMCLIIFFKNNNLGYLWENFINSRNLTAHPTKCMRYGKFQELLNAIKSLDNFLLNKQYSSLGLDIMIKEVSELHFLIIDNPLPKLFNDNNTKNQNCKHSIECSNQTCRFSHSKNISIPLTAQQVQPPPKIQSSDLDSWLSRPRKTPTERRSQHLYVYRPSGRQILRNDIVLYTDKKYVVICGKGGDFDNPKLLLHEHNKRDNEIICQASEINIITE